VAKDVAGWRREAQAEGCESAREWLGKMYESGLSASQIGAKLGLTRSGAYHLLKRFGVKSRPRGGPNRR